MPRILPLLVLIGLTAPAFAAGALDGWNAYKFGMSPDAARAVPGQVFGPYNPKNLWNENKGAMAAKKESVLYGQGWTLNLFFDSNAKLNGIGLENERKASREDCEKNFLSVLSALEKTQGGLAPVNPERKRLDSDTPPTSLEWRVAGASRYQLAVVSFADEYAYAWKARKTDKGNYVELAGTWAAAPDSKSAPCVVSINYSGK